MTKKVLIYQDYGCAHLSPLKKAVERYFLPRGIFVDFTDAAAIKEGALGGDVVAFFMPGGAGTPFREKLFGPGNKRIRAYVGRGGTYFGICAGAYYACTETIFEQGIPELEIMSACGLDLVKGKAIGTLAKQLNILPYSHTGFSSACVQVRWQDGTLYPSYYSGGPFFKASDVEVLATYQSEGDPACVIRGHYGQGTVVLCGVHPEDTGADVLKSVLPARPDFPQLKKIAKQLEQGENSRHALFTKIVQAGMERT